MQVTKGIGRQYHKIKQRRIPKKMNRCKKPNYSKGKRLIVVHIASREGFVNGGLFCFESKTNSSDYHNEINGDNFLQWFKNILPLLNENSVIKMDNGSLSFHEGR